jgi:hypothetical protein
LFPLPRGFSSKRAIITGRFKYSYWNMIQRFVQPVNSRRAAGRKIIAAVRTQSHRTAFEIQDVALRCPFAQRAAALAALPALSRADDISALDRVGHNNCD